MKKLLSRRRAKQEVSTRITNETVAEHRERILAGGRRFKYPMQYARHRLVFNTIIVAVVALVVLVIVGWWQLYSVQNTSSFMYQVTRILPLPVASVDSAQVRYSDYLMGYNASIHYLRQSEQLDLNTENGKRQVIDNKRISMDNAIADAYAGKLARDLDISVTDKEIDQIIDDDRNTANGRISQETYDASALNILGWGPQEYRQDAKSKLIRQEVSYKIDSIAKTREEQALKLLQQDGDFDKAAIALGGTGKAKAMTGLSGLVPLTNRDGGLSKAAAKLEKGQISPVVKTSTGDGYYFVKLLDRNDRQISYAYLRIPLTVFDDQLAALKKDGKVKEYITIPVVKDQD
ncbi:MAG TPA: peptidylprolyl isomerase [Candidatus Saccharimonadales bacterium]|nr:peptidylprolyl isomerase [Candidatus Saccharimonadales bacterium]